MEVSKNEAEEILGNKNLTKIMKLHGHNKIEDNFITENVTYEDYYYCGRCDNCNGVGCVMIDIPDHVLRELTINQVLNKK
jgi:hypothetical protein